MSSNKCPMCAHVMTREEVHAQMPGWYIKDMLSVSCPECGKFLVMNTAMFIELTDSEVPDDREVVTEDGA